MSHTPSPPPPINSPLISLTPSHTSSPPAAPKLDPPFPSPSIPNSHHNTHNQTRNLPLPTNKFSLASPFRQPLTLISTHLLPILSIVTSPTTSH
ncbi:hypothetical protein E2C01_055763 [Portunus trituberculatus]|uniref:Uncharacterized protein n=1 Tax=Portunus trituberculatus TaxID=210409 RepID=A0A5B7GXU6_PORTR|nr:hypothetical protein [Portunus trituberculatus]